MRKKIITYLLFTIIFHPFSKATDYQYRYNDGTTNFKMWIPPTTDTVRGLFLLLNQMMDNPGLDSMIRAASTIEDIALITVFNTNDTSVILNGINQLAILSGFTEIKYAPFATFGHSAAGGLAMNLATTYPNRCFGVVQCNSGGGVNSSALSIPFMVISHTKEQTGSNWINVRNNFLTGIRANGYLSFMINQAGAGHFAWTKFDAKLVSMFLQKAAHYQIPYHKLYSNSVSLKRMNESDGWLSDSAITTDPIHATAPYNAYTGIKSNAHWHFDNEIATLWYTMHREEFNKLPQTITQNYFTMVNGYWADWSPILTLGNISEIPFGASSSTGLPITYQGYFKIYKVENNNVYVDAARYYLRAMDWVTLMQEGNNTYQVAELPIRIRTGTKGGTTQTISFNPITNKNINDNPFPNIVSSTSGLKLDYYIETGSVKLEGTNFVIQDFSGNQSQVSVVYGQGGNSSYATATIQRQNFNISNNREKQHVNFVPISNKIVTDTPFTLSATSTNGGSINYSLYSGPATLVNNKVTLNGTTGTIIVMASVKGDASYNSDKAVQYISVSDTMVTTKSLQQNRKKIKVYPTITKDIVYITNATEFYGWITDIRGYTIKRIDSGTSIIDISDLSNDIYIINILNENEITSFKVIKY